MKSFDKYIKEEIQLKGNKGVPDEFINKTDQEETQRLGVRKDDPRQMMQFGPQIMSLISKSNQLLTRGLSKEQVEDRFKKLEKLAEDVIRNQYESILDNVDLDIKLLRPGKKVNDEMPEMSDVESTPKLQKLDDPEIKLAVDAAKLRNNIIQGEAKNTKNILHSDLVKSGLEEIFGNQWEEVFKTWDEITKVADKMDWIIPIEHKADMMERAPEGMAGAVKVEWPEKKENEDEELSNKILKDLEAGKDINEIEDVDSLLDSGNPKIIAVGVDFPMLLHETVKGIYELISSVAISEDPKKAEIVALNTQSFEDEAEDFRYGPVIAGKLRDAINSCNNIDEVPNVRERVYGKMCLMTDENFLNLMMEIIKETPLSISGLQKLVDEVLDEEREYQQELRDWELDQVLSSSEDVPVKTEDPNWSNKPLDYSEMSQSELQKILDDALDNGDYDLVKKVTPFIKESILLPYKNDILLLERKSRRYKN